MVVIYVVLFEYLTIPGSKGHFSDVITFVGHLPWFLGLFFAIAAILFIYVVGHFVGALGSIGFDRILMESIYGYPVVALLGFKRIRRSYSEATHRYIFLLFNAFLLLSFLVRKDAMFRSIGFLIIGLIVSLIALRILIKWVKVSGGGAVVKKIADNSSVRFLFLKLSEVIEWIEDNTFKALVGMDKSFPEEFQKRYSDSFRRVFKMNPESLSSENYWLSYLYATSQNPGLIGLLKTWLHLYGFARNVSTATFICLFAFGLLRLKYNSVINDENQILFAGMFLTAWVFMARYWMLYQSYHTKNVLRAFVASAEIAGSEEKIRT